MENRYHWYVSYYYSKEDNQTGFGSLEMSSDNEVFVPSYIMDYITKRNNFKQVSLLNWKKLNENQLGNYEEC